MRVKPSTIISSPTRAGYARLCAEVEYDTPGMKPETYWFEVPEKYRRFLSDTGNPWLVCLVPLAAVLGESLKMEMPVDPQLMAGTYEKMRIWKCWYPRLSVIQIEAELLDRPVENDGKICSFFSGGVDAFFTVLYYDRTTDPCARISIHDLVNVWGFDIPLAHQEEQARMAGALRRSSEEMGKEFVEMATNLRETQLEKRANWGDLYAGSALSAAGLALEKRYKTVLISSGADHRDISPTGSSPVTDPLASTSRLRVRRVGGEFSRAQKTECIASSEVAQRALHVCFHIRSEKNCGHCLKCYRTMLTLETLGVLTRYKTFAKGALKLSRAAKMYLWDLDDVLYSKDIERLAVDKSRPDVAQAVRASFRHSRRVRRLLSLIEPMREKQFFRRVYWWLEAKILAGSIGSEERYHPAIGDSALTLDSSIVFARKEVKI